MSATEPITFVSERDVTQQEFEEWVMDRPAEDINRYELLEGRIVMNPPADWPEGEGVAVVGTVLYSFAHPRCLGRIFSPNQGFELPTGDTVTPDTSFISRERWERGPRPVRGKFLRIVPDLAIEVVSPNDPARDLVQKRIIYARSGVREYWVVDLCRREVIVFHQAAEGQFDSGRTLTENDTLRSRVLACLEIPVRELMVSDQD